MSKVKRPVWCPADAVIWGYKVLDRNRKSFIEPEQRAASNHFHWAGDVLSYPQGVAVTPTGFCACDSDCCKGSHFFTTLAMAMVCRLIEGSYSVKECNIGRKKGIIVACYVPAGGEFVSSSYNYGSYQRLHGKKARSSILVCMHRVA